MRVCRYFRHVAVHTPALWTMIDYQNHSQEWTALSLERSTGLPLVIQDEPGHARECFHRARIAVLWFEAVNDGIVNSKAPRLHRLALASGCLGNPEICKITTSFLAGTNTSLVDLSVNWVQLQQFPLMLSLRCLHLECVVVEDWGSFRDSLGHTPNLEQLRILRLYSHFTPPDEAHIPLPCLRSLVLDDSPEKVAMLLRTLPLPSTALGISMPYGRSPFPGTAGLHEMHAGIFAAWLRVNGRDPASTLPAQGRIEVIGDRFARMEFGPRIPTESLWRFSPDTASFCTVQFSSLSGEHSMLSYIETLHLIHTKDTTDSPLLTDASLRARFLPNLKCLILDGYRREATSVLQWEAIRTWVLGQESSINEVHLVRCDDAMPILAQEIRREGIKLVVT